MQNTIPTSILISVLLVCSVYADEPPFPRVTVYGTATTEVVPDQMIWSLRVQNKGSGLEAVASEHTKSVEKVLQFLRESKVDPKAVQTSRMQFNENWEYRSSSRIREGYVASTEIAFKTTDLDLYTRLWLGLAAMSVVSVEGVRFDHTKRIEYQNQTREKAILAAKEKAAASARTLGVVIGTPLLIEEDLAPSEGWEMNYRNAMLSNNLVVAAGAERGPTEALAPGTIPIRIRVKASFQLVPAK